MEVLDFNCIDSYDSANFTNTSVFIGTLPATGADSYEAIASVDPSSGHQGNVNFCIKSSITTDSGEIMTYRSERISLTFSYDGFFSVRDFTTIPYDGISDNVTSATINFGVSAVICDSAKNEINNPPALTLGTNLFVCINTIVPGTNVHLISSFNAQKNSGNSYNILSSVGSNALIKDLDSPNVQVIIIFPARFFVGTGNINLSGNVEVVSATRRALVNSRILQDVSEEIKFSLVVPVHSITDNVSASAHVSVLCIPIIGIIGFLFI